MISKDQNYVFVARIARSYFVGSSFLQHFPNLVF